MQIKYPHKNIYKLNLYFSRHLFEKKFHDRCIQFVKRWQALRQADVPETICQQVIGISRSSYYRYKGRMLDGQAPKRSKRPKRLRKRQWTENDFQQVLIVGKTQPMAKKKSTASYSEILSLNAAKVPSDEY